MKFQDDISNMNTYIHTYVHTYIHTYIRTSRNQYAPHFFKVGGIIMKWCSLKTSGIFYGFGCPGSLDNTSLLELLVLL